MEKFVYNGRLESFPLFERAAAKGHEESIWILSVAKDMDMERKAWREAFSKTDTPLGCYFAGKLSDGREEFDFYQKSMEGGCGWGQVMYGVYFADGQFVEQDDQVFKEWLEKGVNQNNPLAMDQLGNWFRYEQQELDKALSYHRDAAELGWKESMKTLANILDLRQAAIWGAKGDSHVFWNQLGDARRALERRATDDLDCNFDQLSYALGWGLYWYQYGSKKWTKQSDEVKAFGNRCLDYYCSCVELQQKSIFTFLLSWNRTTGVKGPGQMIAQLVWEGREDDPVKRF
jgi:hypothetical protein